MTVETPAILFLLLCSPAIGSFLGVLIDRLPRNENVITSRSKCRSCDAKLRWFELFPIVSFALARGRCNYCQALIPPWHQYVEIAAVGLAILAASKGGTIAEIWLGAIILWLLLALAVTDLIWFRLPDYLTAALAMAVVSLAWTTPWANWWDVSLGALCGAGFFMLVRTVYRRLRGREGLGLGDVKLMLGIGALVGLTQLPLMLLVASSGLLFVAWVGRHSNLKATTPLPFGAALCASSAVLWLFL